MAVKVIVRASFFIISISIFIASVLAGHTTVLLPLPSKILLLFASSSPPLPPPSSPSLLGLVFRVATVCCFNSFVKFSLLVSREPKSVDVSHSFFLLLQIAPSTTIHTLRHAWPRLSSERSSVFHSLAPSILNFFYFFFFLFSQPLYTYCLGYCLGIQKITAAITTTDGRSSSHASIQPTETYIRLPYRGRKSPQASIRSLMYHCN